MNDDGLEAWLPVEGPEIHFYGVDRTPTTFWTKEKFGWKEKLAYRWWRVRCWIARNILRLSCE